MLIFWEIYFGLICLLFAINWSTGGLTTLGVRNFINEVVHLPALLALFGYAFRKKFLSAIIWKVYSIAFIIYIAYVHFENARTGQITDLFYFLFSVLIVFPLYVVPLLYAFRFLKKSQQPPQEQSKMSKEAVNMRLGILPKSSLGRWSVGLVIAFILFFVLGQILAASVHRNPVPNPGPPSQFTLIVVVARYISAIAAFITGLTSIIKSKERSILVFMATVIGFFILIFWLGEVLFPH